MNFWNRLTVATRLTLAFSLLGAALAGMMGLAWWQQARSDALLGRVTDTEYQQMRQVADWQLLATGTTVRIMALNRSTDPGLGAMFGPEIGPRIGEINKAFDAIKVWAVLPEEKALIEAISATSPQILGALDQIAKARKDGDAAAALQAFETGFMPAVKRYHEGVDKFAAYQHEKLTAQIHAAQAEGWRLFASGAGTLGVLVLAVGALVAALVGYIRRSLASAVQVAQAVAAGELGVRASHAGQDEFGTLMRALDGMADSLRQVVLRVRDGTHLINDASRQIAEGNQNLSDRTEQQAQSLQSASSAMHQLAATVRESADSAANASTLAGQVNGVAQRGGEAVSAVVRTMGEIETSSRRIEEIIGVIDGISFQTNILALNAAVEAARAGEQGRGFAVVAGEVRSLAQRSATAAKEIKTLIAGSADKVRSGSQQVAQAGQTMDELVAAVQRVNMLIGEISLAAAQQRSGIDDVSESVTQLDQSTQQNAAMVEEAAAAAGALSQQAAVLAQSVAVFRLEAGAAVR